MPLCCKLCSLSHRFKVWTLIIDSFIWIAKTMLCRIFHRKQHTQALISQFGFCQTNVGSKGRTQVELRGIARPFTDYWSALLHWSGARWVGRVVLLTHRKSSKSRDLLPLRKGCLVVFVLSQATFLSTGQRELLAIRIWTFGEGQV